MTYLVVKSLHIVSFVSWFAALLYGVRLFVYHAEALAKGGESARVLHPQLSLMSRRLWRAIGNPAMIATVVFGTWLMILIEAWKQPWFHLKLLLLAGLFAYHGYLSRIRKQLETQQYAGGSVRLRVLNELGTVFLVMIVFAAVTKSIVASLWALGGFLALAAVIMGALWLRR